MAWILFGRPTLPALTQIGVAQPVLAHDPLDAFAVDATPRRHNSSHTRGDP
jgi:hypothetical protein